VQPNGSRLSCGRPARRRKGVRRSPCPAQGHNTPLPLERSPPASFKRLLGSGCTLIPLQLRKCRPAFRTPGDVTVPRHPVALWATANRRCFRCSSPLSPLLFLPSYRECVGKAHGTPGGQKAEENGANWQGCRVTGPREEAKPSRDGRQDEQAYLRPDDGAMNRRLGSGISHLASGTEQVAA